MRDWTWKQRVADSIIRLANSRRSVHFSIDDVYEEMIPDLARTYPRNRHVKEKTRQMLQRLRDDGFLVFLGAGRYEVNLECDEFTGEPDSLQQGGFELPRTKTVVRTLRLRSTVLAVEIKRRYGHTCQLCGTPVVLADRLKYAEAHHLWPIGMPHFGPDVPGNIIVVCPNHHILFDRGAVMIVPKTLAVTHAVSGALPSDARLYVQPWHDIKNKYLAYHNAKIFQTA